MPPVTLQLRSSQSNSLTAILTGNQSRNGGLTLTPYRLLADSIRGRQRSQQECLHNQHN